MKSIFLILFTVALLENAWAQSVSDSTQTLYESNNPILDPSCFQAPYYWNEVHFAYVVTDSAATSVCIRDVNSKSLSWMDPSVVYSSNTSKRYPVGAVGTDSLLSVFWQEEVDGKSLIQVSLRQNGVWTSPKPVLQSELSQSEPTVAQGSYSFSPLSLGWIENDSVVYALWSPDSVYAIRRWKNIPTSHVANPILSLDIGAPFLAWEESADSSKVIQYVFLNDTSSIHTLAYGDINWNARRIRGWAALAWSVPSFQAVNIWAATFTPWFTPGNQVSVSPLTNESSGECMAGGGTFFPVVTGAPRLDKSTDFTMYHFFSWRWRFVDSTAIVIFYPPLYPPTRKELWSKDSLGLPIVSPSLFKNDSMFCWTVWVQASADHWRLKATLTGFPYHGGGVQPSNPPETFRLSQNYPNPFNPLTTIRFGISERSNVRLRIFNLLGQPVAELANEEMNAGYFERTWNAKAASGMYFYSIEAVPVTNPTKRLVDVKKMILLK